MNNPNPPPEDFMRKALELAERGAGFVSPNPLVGAVIVKNNQVIGEGYHAKYGGPHAEVNAISDAEKNGHDVAGAEIFVTLEPCNHFGKTPPCADHIIQKQLSKVTFAAADPNPQAVGGAEKLRAAGIAVVSGILEQEAHWQNRFFFHALQKQRPYFLAKAAISADGKGVAAAGERTEITGKESELYTHRLRQMCDAILVGANTIVIDNPLLSVRHGKNPRDPFRIILDPHFRTSMLSRVYRDLNYLVVTLPSDSPNMKKQRNILELPAGRNGRFDLHRFAQALFERNIRSVLVEGGPKTLAFFLDAGLIDELDLLTAVTKTFPKGLPFFSEGFLPGFALRESRKQGVDELNIYSHDPC